ncbi:Yos1-like protein [Calycina marina]|uniref:Yos1-like protein n=1 Tax=Calycina marina TaxID=1763456 RepID=A0A9P7Z0T4_9HELO|nr:Yos1-like protein [Calycina marina]
MFFLPFGNLIYMAVLIINAIAILSEDRFLARVGWSTSTPNTAAQSFGGGGGGEDTSIKSKLVNLISSVRTLMRIPLIGINLIIIGIELVAG